MSNAKCLNLSHPIVKQNIKDISKQLGLQDSTISLNEYKAIVRAFSIYKGIENEDVLDYIGSQEYDDFLNDYFNIGKSIEFSSDLEEKILEFLEQNKEYINTPLEDTTENRMIANGIYIATEEKAQIVNLANNKFIVKINPINHSSLADDIYYNLSSKSLEDFLKNKHLVHNYNGQHLITKKDTESLDKVEANFKKELAKLGYSEDSVRLTRQANSIRVEVLEAKRKADYIEAEIDHSMSSIKNVIDFLTEKIPALKDKVHYNVSKSEAKKVLGDAYSDNVNSFVHNGEIYLLEGKATEDIAIEEALHILTESLIIDNKTLAYELLHEAEKLFPQLVDEIRRTYEGADTQNREILTQALARVFRQEFNEGERQAAESILSKFINWIKQLFGINPTTGNTIIELDELSTDMTLRDFAQLINSSNAEFKTWSHNKTQFNKSSIKFTTSEGSYAQRTQENADRSDITLALAIDFNTAGEKKTKSAAKDKYIASPLPDDGNSGYLALQAVDYYAEKVYKELKKKGKTSNIKLNIAGNGIYTLAKNNFATQEDINNYVEGIISKLQSLGVTISEIRSGGQTGVDEAGIIAAQRLGIPAVVHGTKDWAFRGKDGKDVKGDEKAYKARFNVATQPTPKAKGKMTFSYG